MRGDGCLDGCVRGDGCWDGCVSGEMFGCRDECVRGERLRSIYKYKTNLQ